MTLLVPLYKFWKKYLQTIQMWKNWSVGLILLFLKIEIPVYHKPLAILEYLSKQSKINVVTMKYSLAGHSFVQVVDKIHLEVEVAMWVTKFYSPMSFLRILLKVTRNCPNCVIPIKSEDFKDFQNSPKML